MWDSKWANSTTEKVLSHNRTRQYLDMPKIVSITYHKMYKKINKANNSKQKASLDVSPPAIINTQAPQDQHAPLPFSEPSPEPFSQSPTTLQSILETLPTCCDVCKPTLKEWKNKWSDKDVTNLFNSFNERQQTLNGISQVNDINADAPCAGSRPSIQTTSGLPPVTTPDPIARNIIPPRPSTRGGNQTTIVNSGYLAKLKKGCES